MRRKLRGNSNLLWWCNGGGGDLGRYENVTSDCLTTTEEFTDAKMSDAFNPVYPVHSSRMTRTCNLSHQYCSVKKRSRPKCCLPSYYDGLKEVHTQPRLVLRDRRPSRRSLMVRPRHRVPYTVVQPPSPQPPQVRKSQKVLVYSSSFPAECEKEQRARLFWRKSKKRPGMGRLVSLRSQAVDSSTSADVKSVCSNYSRLSVDVTNEMQAMYRDIETILTRYESAFDNTIQNELEERGLGKEKKKQKPDVAVRSPPPQLTPQQQALLAMDKPPLDRLAEIPIEYLKPRPPRMQGTVDDNTGSTSATAVLTEMLQGLMNRGIMAKLDEPSQAKFEAALSGVPQPIVLSAGVSSPAAGAPPKEDGRPSDSTCVLRPEEKTMLSETDKLSKSANSTAQTAAANFPNLERTVELIPVDRVNDDKNWRKTLIEIEKESHKASELNTFKKGGAGDWPINTSVNTDVGQAINKDLGNSSSENRPSGDQITYGAQGMSDRAAVRERRVGQRSTISLHENTKEKESNITINTELTDGSIKTSSLDSGTTTCICEDLTTNTSSGVGISGVMVEDVEEEERPLQRTVERTSLSKFSRSSNPSETGRLVNRMPMSSSVDKRHLDQSSSDVAKHGAGDSHTQESPRFKRNLDRLMNSNTVEQQLVKLREALSQHTEDQVNPDICLEIIGKLTELLLQKEPIITKEINESCITGKLRMLRTSHLRHIMKEVEHIKHLSRAFQDPSFSRFQSGA